ncbi:hypothetical protein HD554DRAFT_838732 [Boletus coccyginus]|nr:hypothetical protein HD554DRAFT_838732 [Boletus coccyginus]
MPSQCSQMHHAWESTPLLILHVDITLDMSCATGMHAFHSGGQGYKQRLTPCGATVAREVKAPPTSHSVSPAPSMVGNNKPAPLAPFPPHLRATLSFSATCRRQRAFRRRHRLTHPQTPQGGAPAYQHSCQRQRKHHHHHDTYAQVVPPSERPRSDTNHHTPTLVLRLDTRIHVGSYKRIPGRARCEQPDNTTGGSAPIPVWLTPNVSTAPAPVGKGTPSTSAFCSLRVQCFSVPSRSAPHNTYDLALIRAPPDGHVLEVTKYVSSPDP